MQIFQKEKDIFEYDEHDQATWKYQQLPSIPQDFENELVSIAGLNPHGKPKLRVVKGNEIQSDKSEKYTLKYHCGFTPSEVSGYRYAKDGRSHFVTNIDDLPTDVLVMPEMGREELGLLRYVIEKWTSPEELERQHRFQQRYDAGELSPTLRRFPRDGVYDAYFVVENAKGKFRKLDKDVLSFLKAKWKYDQKSEKEKELDRERALEKAEIDKQKRQDELWRAAANFDLKLDKEEQERRDHYWATKDDYEADLARYKNTVAFYQTT